LFERSACAASAAVRPAPIRCTVPIMKRLRVVCSPYVSSL
jgi:hypothetical protein